MFSRRREASSPSAAVEPLIPQPLLEGADDLLTQVETIEAAAAEIYARYGLPDQPGHYRRRSHDTAWERLTNGLLPEEKWRIIQDAPPDLGWRYASLSQIGAGSVFTDVRHASAILSACHGLRLRLTERLTISPQDLADAIRLGVSWRLLSDTAAASQAGAAEQAPSLSPSSQSTLSSPDD
ncbi:hypothetical protein [Brevundimonas faecalis]|uniref:DNA-binding transcriptional regulator YdaS (Cro superfamily) n=1 Tax=Brevundimonas faecalis TaxID=947378 RepID=A0ABV2R6R3_9CAUL